MGEQKVGNEGCPLRVAVIGAGPSGYYATAALQKALGNSVQVDIFDRLPTPFGLVRGGVAPDHQKIKNVTRIYERISKTENCRFIGNVKIGVDLQVETLCQYYDQIVLATGNESDRKLSIPGEELEGVFSATEFVGWYNAHPDFRYVYFPLSKAKRVAVVGNGNVSMDVTRILMRSANELAETDIASFALSALYTSSVDELLLLGRRGPAQSAFSPKEIKEIGALSGVDLLVSADDMALDQATQSWLEKADNRDAQKNLDFLNNCVALGPTEGNRKIHCHFLVSPVAFHGKEGKLEAVELEKNRLEADANGVPRAVSTGETWLEPVDLVFKAIGYRGIPIKGVPFHEKWGVFPNADGRLTETHQGEAIPNQYVVGWAKRGPSGLIGSNAADSKATVNLMLEDLENGSVKPCPKRSTEELLELLKSNNVDVVDFEDWERLDSEERRRGEAAGKIREKFFDTDEMMKMIQILRT